MTEYDMDITWIEFDSDGQVTKMIETEYDGMECDGSSEPFEFDNGFYAVQPNFIQQG